MKYSKRMKPKWSNIHIVQDKLDRRLKNEDKGFVDSVKMVSGELLENSVKYYMHNNIRKPIEFSILYSDELSISLMLGIKRRSCFSGGLVIFTTACDSGL